MSKLKERFELILNTKFFKRKLGNRKTKPGLAPLPKSVTNLYGLIAILLVVIPEWLAERTILLSEIISDYKMPKEGAAWQLEDELRLASMSLFDLRKLAKEVNLTGYSSESRFLLTKRILTKLDKKQIKLNQF